MNFLGQDPPLKKNIEVNNLIYVNDKKGDNVQIIYRKELSNFNSKFLKNIKSTLLRRMEIGQMTRNHNNMLIDVLSELDFRKSNSNHDELRRLDF